MRNIVLLILINTASIAVFASPLGLKGLAYGVVFASLSAIFYLRRNDPPLLGARPGEKPVGFQMFGKPPPNLVSAYVIASVGVSVWLLVQLLNFIWPGCKPSCA